VDTLAYDNPAYEHSVIGSMEDLNAASVEDVASFFKTYYAPNNAVVAIVGDVDTKTTLEKVRRAFESIPAQPAPPTVNLAEPKQVAERRQQLADPLARLARVDIVFKVPPRLTADDDALQVLGTVLSSGRSSRLFQQIVREQQLAPNVTAFRDGAVGPGLFRVIGMVTPGKTPEAFEAAVIAEIERVKSEPIADWELEKARNNAKRAVVAGLTSSLQRAMQLADFAASFGDTHLINQRVERLMKISAADVQRVAKTYLTPENRTVVVTTPKGAKTEGGAR
jgi:predicted Zn-dependent peptidase